MDGVQSVIPDIIGLVGISFILAMYFLLQIGKLRSEDSAYSLGNLFGSACLLFSLFFDWNISAVILQCCWITISLYGILKAYRLRSNHA
jgi:hypothetical protein